MTTVTRTGLDVTGVPTIETSALGKQVEWSAIGDDGVVTLYAAGPRRWRDGTVGRMRTAADEAFAAERRGRNDAAVASPTGDTVTLGTTASAPAADFLVEDGSRSGRSPVISTRRTRRQSPRSAGPPTTSCSRRSTVPRGATSRAGTWCS